MALVEEKKKRRLTAQQEESNLELFRHLKEKERERNEPLKKISPDYGRGVSKIMLSRDPQRDSLHYTLNGKVRKVDNGEYFWKGGVKVKQSDDYDTSQYVIPT